MRHHAVSRFLVPVVAVLSLLNLTIPRIRAHCGPYIPPEPVPEVPPAALPADTYWIYPLRWSWLHWWEANREPYLLGPRQNVSQEVQPEVIKAERGKAAAALSRALGSKDAAVRANAALALGQMAAQELLANLSGLAQGDPSPEVRQAASLALGLLDGKDAEAALSPRGKFTEPQQIARSRGLGLMSALAPATVRQLTTWGNRTGIAVRVSGVWARRQAAAGNADLYKHVLTRTDNVWLASEAILALGRSGDRQAIAVLADLLLASDRGKALPAWRRLDAIRLEKLDMAGVLKSIRTRQDTKTVLAQFHKEYLLRHAFWNDGSLSPYPTDGMDPRTMIYTIRLGWEEIYLGNLRAAAAIALGDVQSEESCKVLMASLQQFGDEFGGHWNDVNALARAHEFSHLHKGMALMSLGRLGYPMCVDLLVATLAGNIVTKLNKAPEEMANSPLRGYAALALGLYIRPRDTPQGPVDPPGFDKITDLLASYAANPNETSEVRSACTLALGLSRRTATSRLFPPITETAAKLNDAPQIGFDLMARSLLGDRKIVEPVKRMLDVPEPVGATGDMIGRRAAVLALGIHGAQEAIPVLNAAWHQSHYVNREIGLAMALCRGYSVTDALVDVVDNGPNSLARVFGARCLGDLFMPDGPRRLARFLNGSNYAMRDNTSLFPRALANEFLMNWLIPAFGEIWY